MQQVSQQSQGALQTLQTLQLYTAINIKIEKLFIWHETKVRLDIIAPRLGAYFDLTQQLTFE